MMSFGLYCQYTDTRKDKFIFDDIGIRIQESDTIKPFIIKAEIEDDLHLKIEFNETTNEMQSLDISNYTIDLTRHPMQINKSTTDEKIYILTFEKAFEPSNWAPLALGPTTAKEGKDSVKKFTKPSTRGASGPTTTSSHFCSIIS